MGAQSLLADSGRGRHAQFYVVPTPHSTGSGQAVTIDGHLDDWDLSGQIEMFVIEATRSTMSAKIAAMYDDEALYLSGEVRDPTPMMNMHAPGVNTNKAWDADSVQFRLVIDPEADFPVEGETSFRYRGTNADVDTRDDIVHMLLWHYTGDGSANLQMQKGMSYRSAHPDWPEGLVPGEKFEGAYREWDDGTGYTFEYRIPWSTMGAENPPRGGDKTAGTVNVFWSRPDGIATGGGSSWAYDIMHQPGFPFQSADTWGRLIFAEEGNVPEELVMDGLPPEMPLPLEFSYDLPEDGVVTLQLFNEAMESVRILVAQEERPGGRNTERWDGMNDYGEPLPAGTYTWRGILGDPIEAKYRFSVHNSGQPPYPTDDNRGGWGSDHGTPFDVAALPNGMLLSWGLAEYGWALLRTNNEGRRQWGSKRNADHLATDGQRIYLAGGYGFLPDEGVRMVAVADARPMRFDSGVATLTPPPGGGGDLDQVSGLAYADGVVYIAYQGRDLVARFSTRDGSLLGTWDVPAPRRLAARPDGSLAVVSEGGVLLVVDGEARPWIDGSHVASPQGIAVDAAGKTYVANRGELQNVSVFDVDGKFVRSIGRSGGRPSVGAYDSEGMYQPLGIALDAQNRLWVAENSDFPKRFSVWDTESGGNLKEFFGGAEYFAHGAIDPARPDEFIGQNMIWSIDWENYQVEPVSTFWRKTESDMAPHPLVDSYTGNLRLFTADNGFQYAWSGAGNRRGKIVYLREGDLFRPVAGVINPWTDRYAGLDDYKEALRETWERERTPGHQRSQDQLWVDLNGDGRVQPEELTPFWGVGHRADPIWIDHSDLTLRFSGGHVLPAREFTEAGEPRYFREDVSAGQPGGRYIMSDDSDGSIYTLTQGQPSAGLVKHSSEGEKLWSYPDMIHWQQALGLSIIKAGRLWGMTQPMGVAGDFFAHQTYMGPAQIFRKDGQYIGTILEDSRIGGRGAYEGQPEGQGGTFVQLEIDGELRIFSIGGGQDIRVWEVLGLDSLRDLSGGTYEHTPELVAKAEQARAEFQAMLATNREIVVVPGRENLAEAPVAERRLEGNRAFSVQAAYDARYLYFRYEVTAPHGLVNQQSDPETIFRGGNLLDIQLATDPKANPEREQPAPGDLRILATTQNGKPMAVLYRPRIEGFDGRRIILESPTGTEPFDAITVMDDVDLSVEATADGFIAILAVPKDAIGLELESGANVRMDLGYIFGNEGGTRTAIRAYLHNDSFSANVIDDIPNESRLEPAEWGNARVE